MRILMIATAFNSLSQRLWVELEQDGHDLSLEFDVNDAVLTEAARLARPDAVVAPYLTRLLPESVWRAVPCLIVHPGPPGDRGPAALDRAILEGATEWGVTVLQATGEADGGPVHAFRRFPMRAATKSSLYRGEVTEAAVACVREALRGLARGEKGTPPELIAPPRFRPKVEPAERAIDWASDTTATVLAKLRSADGRPGVADTLMGLGVKLHDPSCEALLKGEPGAVIAHREGAVCRATTDGAVWIGALGVGEKQAGERPFKRAAVDVLGDRLRQVPHLVVPFTTPDHGVTRRSILYREANGVGYLAWELSNGAMSTAFCKRLTAAYRHAQRRPVGVIVLSGGREFWSNGMDLNAIENAASPADASLANIEAIDDLAHAILTTTDKLTIAAIEGNAGAGGVFLALAADRVWLREGVVLNPHYKNMGNLYGSEYWTYVLPRRVGAEGIDAVMATRRPIGAVGAVSLGLVDGVLPNGRAAFRAAVAAEAAALAADPSLPRLLAEKAARRALDEAARPLAAYRTAELAEMRRAFYGFDPSYHVARWRFVTKEPHARTPLHLARHRAA